MTIRHFEDTATLYIEFQDRAIVETWDLDENTTIDMDAEGNVLAITFEHASTRTDLRHLRDASSNSFRLSAATAFLRAPLAGRQLGRSLDFAPSIGRRARPGAPQRGLSGTG